MGTRRNHRRSKRAAIAPPENYCVKAVWVGRLLSTIAFVPLVFELGEAFQFDWSEERLVVGGIYYRMQVSHLKLCASRAFWLVAYPSEGHEMLFDVSSGTGVKTTRPNETVESSRLTRLILAGTRACSCSRNTPAAAVASQVQYGSGFRRLGTVGKIAAASQGVPEK